MNNEPVAWMIIDVDNGKSLQFEENKFSEINIPLYTAPRELSDEEIKEIWYDLYPLSSSSYWDDKREGLAELKFAKAILRKAQEK